MTAIGSIDSGSAMQAVLTEKRFSGIGNRTEATPADAAPGENKRRAGSSGKTSAVIAAPNRNLEANDAQTKETLRSSSSGSAESAIVTLSAESRNALSDARLAEAQASAATAQGPQVVDDKAEQAAPVPSAPPISDAQMDDRPNAIENSIKSSVTAAYSGNMSLSQAAQASLSRANQQTESVQNAEANLSQTGTQALSQANQQAQSVLRMF